MPRPPRPEDLYELRVPLDTQLSPDGRFVAFPVKDVAPGKDGYRTAIWLAAADGSAPARQITLGSASDDHLRWSPDGTTLAFLSDRGAVLQAGGAGECPGPAERPADGGVQVWLLPMHGGEARQLTRLPHDVRDIAWSPDGRRMCVVSTAESEQPPRRQERRPGDPPPSDYRFVDRLQYQENDRALRSDAGFVHDRHAHLWLVDVETGALRRLTSGTHDDSGPMWSPDGRRIAFESRRQRDADLDWQMDIFLLDVASGRVDRLTGGRGRRSFAAPRWSPDGAWIAAIGHRFPGRGTPRQDAWRFRAEPEQEGEDLTGASDLMLAASLNSDLIGHGSAELRWSPDGRRITFAAPVEGSYELWHVDVERRSVERLTQGQHYLTHVDQVALPGGGVRISAARCDATHPFEIVTFDVPANAALPVPVDSLRVVSDLMGSRWQEIALVEPIVRWHEVEGRRIQGWYYPAQHPTTAPGRSGAAAPLVVEIHGGPATLYGASLMWEWQCLIARGMSVYACNPRGSEGYGQDFVRANFRDWGDGPMRDVMAGVDALIADGLADPDRLGVTGGSYGGYLTSWIVGRTDRFKAAVTCRSVNDMTSEMLSGDIGGPMFGDEEYGAQPWEEHALFWEHSPLAHVANVHTPLLIQHAERDLRVPVTQAEEFFAALRALRRPVRLMRVPDETHELTRSGAPFHRVENDVQIAAWFHHFLVLGRRGLPPLPREVRARA